MSERVALYELEKAKKGLLVWNTVGACLGGIILLAVSGVVLWGLWSLGVYAIANPGAWWGIGIAVFIGTGITAIARTESHEKTIKKAELYGVIDE